MTTKITKVWFDKNLGEIQQQEIPYESIFVPVKKVSREELAEMIDPECGVRETTMRLTREELQGRFMAALPKATASRILGIDPVLPGSDKTVEWWGRGFANTNQDFNTVNYTGPQIAGTGLIAAIKRAHEDMLLKLEVPQPYYLTAGVYDMLKDAGMALGGVTRMEPHRYEVPRPPAAAPKRAALHPLVGRLIDNLNKEN